MKERAVRYDTEDLSGTNGTQVLEVQEIEFMEENDEDEGMYDEYVLDLHQRDTVGDDLLSKDATPSISRDIIKNRLGEEIFLPYCIKHPMSAE
ncbi:hypothetical protein NDU88_001347 [Pleurodeles waltl]|uniref:Uncharacterized protein n=1 Tax=Pleurodeles waltl TaxID=8319 RepID=A0AAV7WLP1_PLEWA|nr:hypothetical protein NDU88_001347 [Pleurodeles waltl]